MSLRYPLVLLLAPLAIWLLHRALRARNSGRALRFPIAHRGISLGTLSKLPVLIPFEIGRAHV